MIGRVLLTRIFHATTLNAMMDMMIADLDKEITEVEVEEKNAQEEYEQLIQDSVRHESVWLGFSGILVF